MKYLKWLLALIVVTIDIYIWHGTQIVKCEHKNGKKRNDDYIQSIT